ncbi:MAG: AI-2E family transporter [Rhodospirillaceae bacterium]
MSDAGAQSVPEAKERAASPRSGVSLVVLCILGLFYTAYFAQLVLIPIAFAFLLYLVLSPLVRFLDRRLHVPRAIGAILAVSLLVSGLMSAFYLVSGPAAVWMDKLPGAAIELEYKLRILKSSVEDVAEATRKVEQFARDNDGDGDRGGNGDGGDRPLSVVLEGPSLAKTLLGRTTTLTAGIVIATVLLLFLLASGETMLRQVVSTVPALSGKKKLVEAMREIESDISHYLLAVTLINVGLGICVGLSMWMLGIPNPILWGGMSAVLNFIPYVGAIVNVAVIGLVSLVTFDTVPSILLPPLVVLMLNTVEGQFITPALVARRLALNPVAVVLSLILWGWLWGIPGTLVAVPFLACLKIVADRMEGLRTVGALLGRPAKPAPA